MSAKRSSESPQKARVIAYIDGFNVYYGLKNACRDSDRQHLICGGSPADCLGRMLYWLDLEKAILGKLKRSETCETIKYFSAPRRVPKLVSVDDKAPYLESNSRQQVHFDALRTRSRIEIILGWYSENKPHRCGRCDHEWPHFEEKVTDVNIATHMLQDAYEDRLDRALVVSADADLVPPVEAVRRIGKDVVLCLFPGRKRAKHLRSAASEVRAVTIKYLRARRFPEVIERAGLSPLMCPDHWRAPGGWVWDSPAPIRDVKHVQQNPRAK